MAATGEESLKERTPRLDWAGLLRRAFSLEVFTRVRCGGRRRVLEYLTAPGGVRAIVEHLRLPWLPGRLKDRRVREHVEGEGRSGGAEEWR